MGKRYFYTDPIKAAWMSQEHDLKIQSTDFCDGDLDDGYNGVDIAYWSKEGVIKPPYYIHPDCHDKIKPQLGDLVHIYDDDGESAVDWVNKVELYADRYADCYSDDEKIEPHLKNRLCYSTAQDNVLFREYDSKHQIIQRNGKAWFTPEVEDE